MKHSDKLGLSAKPNKTPWHLRFAPGDIRQRLNQWNGRKKTALVTAAGTFAYQYRANAAWPLILTVAGGTAFLVKVFTAYGITYGLNAAFNSNILKETAVADSDKWLYSKRKLRVRAYDFDEAGNRTLIYSVDAQAEANQLKAYDTSGTDSYLLELGYSSDALTKSEVLYEEVDDNDNLSGATIIYDVEELVDGEWDTLETGYDSRKGTSDHWLYVTYGGYIPEPTAAELQKRLDDYRSEWNAMASTNRWMYPNPMGPLRVSVEIRSAKETFVCNKAVKLWSDFEFNRVPGDTTAGPKELQTPGKRSKYVTRISYKAREAGYNGGIVTRSSGDDEPFIEYPEPKSYENDYFKPFTLSSENIPWDNFQIIGDSTWTGTATRCFEHKKIY